VTGSSDQPPGRWEYVERARAESARGEVVLRERRVPDAAHSPDFAGVPAGFGVLELRVNGVFVMDTLETATERELARTALAQVADPRTVLVAGLGLGCTAHEVLGDARVKRVVVVEIEEAVVGWMRDGTVPHGPSYLADDRLSIVTADIRQAVAEASPTTYDLVLLDVDNGPGFLVHAQNAAVYDAPFLHSVATLLRPGGAVAVWSAAEAPELADELTMVFAAVTTHPLTVRLQGRDERYWLYVARR